MSPTTLLAITCSTLIVMAFIRRSNPSRLIHDPSINSSGSFSSLLIHIWKLCKGNFDCCLDRIMDMNSGIKSKGSHGRNQRRYRSPNRLSDGHTGVLRHPGVAVIPRLFEYTGGTTSDRRTFAPSEEGSALSITNSSKVDMNAIAFIQASVVASILIWRTRGGSRPSRKARLENRTNS